MTTFKDNDSIERGLITGITRISNDSQSETLESIFSELNHLEVVTTLSDKYFTSLLIHGERSFSGARRVKPQ